MKLSNLTSIYELFAAFNLAYAGIENFSGQINNIVVNSFKDVYQIKKDKALKRYVDLNSQKEQLGDKYDTDILSSKINDAQNDFEKEASLFDNTDLSKQFDLKFKTLYLIVALYSLSMLFLIGYKSNLYSDSFWLAFNLLNQCIIAYIIVIFAASIFTQYNRARPIITIAIFAGFLTLVVAHYYSCNNSYNDNGFWHIDKNKTIITSLVILPMPFAIHFLRSQLHNIWLSVQFQMLLIKNGRAIKDTERKLQELRDSDEIIAQYTKKPIAPPADEGENENQGSPQDPQKEEGD